MNHEFLDYVEDILDAMDKAEALLADVDFAQFEADYRINFAVVRALEIVGEATKRLPGSLRKQYPDLPWKDMAGMRDRIIHGYDAINLRVVWDTVKIRIPAIKPKVKQILDDYKGL
ncbi:MAG: DUF86 domain-containing protein [Anaerolineales bacterium]|nr:DUF86 domain-containing protein [Anaerolineales bacterium]